MNSSVFLYGFKRYISFGGSYWCGLGWGYIIKVDFLEEVGFELGFKEGFGEVRKEEDRGFVRYGDYMLFMVWRRV